MTADSIVATVSGLAARVAGPGRMPDTVGRATRLADELWFDSAEMLELLVACEVAFDIRFDERHDFAPGTLDTIGAVADLVARKQREQGRP